MSDGIYRIFIPSKNRADKPLTTALLDNVGLTYTLVVEPNELKTYQIAYGEDKVVSLPENDMGIAYSRQFILDMNDEPFWMLDDDISTFYQTINRGTRRTPADIVLRNSQDIITSQPNWGIGGLQYNQFAWACKYEYVLNAACFVSVLVNPKIKPFVSYDQRLIMKEDVDFLVQILSAGFMGVQVNKYSHGVPRMGSNKGGLFEKYADQTNIEHDIKLMVEKHPAFAKPVVKKNGTKDVKINWRAFR